MFDKPNWLPGDFVMEEVSSLVHSTNITLVNTKVRGVVREQETIIIVNFKDGSEIEKHYPTADFKGSLEDWRWLNANYGMEWTE